MDIIENKTTITKFGESQFLVNLNIIFDRRGKSYGRLNNLS